MTTSQKLVFQVISLFGLALSIVPAVLVFNGAITKQVLFNLMLLGMVLWFGTAVFWIKPDHLGE